MFCWLISLNKQNHMAHDGVHAQQSLFPNRGGIGMRLFTPRPSPMIGADGPFSFNYKLAVLVSEADGQIKKVRHAHLIPVNLPLHI